MSSEDRGAHAGLNIGRTLELARKERGLSLNEVEQATKIRATYLRDLERENFDVLPAVYMQGSLKTYANFLHLDGEAMTRELRRRQASQHEPQAPTHAELQRGDYFDRSLIFLGDAAVAKGQTTTEDEDDAGSGSILAGGNLLYLGSAAFLVLVLVALALALILPENSRPEVSQLHEPLISQAPSQIAGSSSEENERSQPQEDDEQERANDENDNRQPDQQTGPDEDDAEPLPTGQDQGDGQLAQAPPPDATAIPAAPQTPQEESEGPQTPQNEPAQQPDAASTQPPPAPPDQANAAPANQGGGAPPPDARGTREPRTTSRGPRGNGGFQVQIVVGAEDPVRITGSPVADR